MRKAVVFFAGVLGIWGFAFAQGGSAVIALELPPAGGSGYHALQTGGAHPGGVAGLYYNPALLTESAAATGTHVSLSHAREEMIFDARRDFSGVSLVIPDARRGFDVGVAYTRTYLELAPAIPDIGVLPDSFRPNETVHALGAGLRLGGPISIGGTVKYYDSQILSVSAGQTKGWAFDAGVLVLQRFRPFAFDGFHSFDIAPSLGITFANFGPDVVYGDADVSDPLPTLLRGSLGMNLRLADVVDIAWGYDRERYVHRRADDAKAVETYGYSIWTLGYRFSRGQLEDPEGMRSEVHTAQAFELSLLQVHRMLARIRSGDFRSPFEVFDGGYPIPLLRVLGFDWRPNPQVVIGKRSIHEDADSGVGSARDGQEGWYFSVSL